MHRRDDLRAHVAGILVREATDYREFDTNLVTVARIVEVRRKLRNRRIVA